MIKFGPSISSSWRNLAKNPSFVSALAPIAYMVFGSRLANYDQRTLLPRFGGLAFRAGYTITYRRLLYWANPFCDSGSLSSTPLSCSRSCVLYSLFALIAACRAGRQSPLSLIPSVTLILSARLRVLSSKLFPASSFCRPKITRRGLVQHHILEKTSSAGLHSVVTFLSRNFRRVST